MQSIFNKQASDIKIAVGEYYAFTESYDIISDNSVYIRLDCIKKELADRLDSTQKIVRQIDEVPSVVFEINSDPNELKKITGVDFEEDTWYFIKVDFANEGLDAIQTINGEVIDRPARITLIQEGDPDVIEKLEVIFNLDSIDNTTAWSEETIRDWMLINRKDFDSVAVYNVGQGNINALISQDNIPLLYFDMGGGFGSCKQTYPLNQSLTTCSTICKTVILSHWDLDHVETALRDNKNSNFNWIVPWQKIGNTHLQLALSISQHGHLMIWPVSLNSFHYGHFHIYKCAGTKKNDTGLSLLIKNLQSPIKNVLLTGDCDYRFIPIKPKIVINGIVVPHHGAKLLVHNIQMAPKNHCIVYSYGLKPSGMKTHFGHPTPESIDFHSMNGWINRHDTINGHIAMKRSGTYNVPCNGKCTLAIQQFV